jgi:hypothetical protein
MCYCGSNIIDEIKDRFALRMNQPPLKVTVELRVNIMAARPTRSAWLYMHKYATINNK